MVKQNLRLGRVVATPGALRVLEIASESPITYLDRHTRGDWGELCKQDWESNDMALRDGSRLLSAYKTQEGARLWIITEAEDENQQRPVTTLLLPEEY